MASRRRVVVLLSESEYAHIKTRAGIVPLSAYIRNLVLPRPTLPGEIGNTMGFEYDDEQPITKPITTDHKPCKHGLMFCKKCA